MIQANIWFWLTIGVLILYIITAIISAHISHKATVSRTKYIEAVQKHNNALYEYTKAVTEQNTLLKEIVKFTKPEV